LLAVLVACGVAGCAADTRSTEPGAAEMSAADEPDEDVAGPAVDTQSEPVLPAEADEDPFAADPQLAAEADAQIDNGIPGDDAEAERNLANPELTIQSGGVLPKCTKRITVISTVGVPGASKFRTNGCWTVIVTDGAARPKDYRKCSTGTFDVQNPKAPSYAYDDTNPLHPLGAEKRFLERCAAGATGVGWEFMAYRGAWRLLHTHHLRAYFAELYGSSPRDIDSLWYVHGVYRGNDRLARRTHVFPMINFGTPRAAKLERRVAAETYKTCRSVRNRGYFGLYNASWREGMPVDDPRLRAVERGLNACTTR
jgi:hypothetical protein